MPATSYHGGHSLADILRVWLSRLSLPQAQECLARLIAAEQVTITPPLPDSWWLRWDHRQLVVESSGPASGFRCHFSDPRLMDPVFVFDFLDGFAPPSGPPPISEHDPERLTYEAEDGAEAEAPQQAPPDRQPLQPKAWWDKVRKAHPRKRGQDPTAYALDLHSLMKAAKQAGEVTKLWEFKGLRRRLYDKQPAAQKVRKK